VIKGKIALISRAKLIENFKLVKTLFLNFVTRLTQGSLHKYFKKNPDLYKPSPISLHQNDKPSMPNFH